MLFSKRRRNVLDEAGIGNLLLDHKRPCADPESLSEGVQLTFFYTVDERIQILR